MAEIKAAKKRFGLPENAPVVSCYEAGRDGFWIASLPPVQEGREPRRRLLEHRGQPPQAAGQVRPPRRGETRGYAHSYCNGERKVWASSTCRRSTTRIAASCTAS